MDRKDIAIAVFVLLLLVVWGPFYQKVSQKFSPESVTGSQQPLNQPSQPVVLPARDAEPGTAGGAVLPATTITQAAGNEKSEEPVLTSAPQKESSAGEAQEESGHAQQEVIKFLSNGNVKLAISSWGGGVVSAELAKYRQTVDPTSSPVILNFSASPSLSYAGIPGLTTNNDFELSVEPSGAKARVERQIAPGVLFTREIKLGENYRLMVTDRFQNSGTEPFTLKKHGICIGPMKAEQTRTKTKGVVYLGIDTLASSGGESVTYWARGPRGEPNLQGFFQEEARRGGCAMFKPKMTKPLPCSIHEYKDKPTDWVAVKSRFFVQILVPEQEAAGYVLQAKRLVPAMEDPQDSRTWAQAADIDVVWSELRFSEQVISPGAIETRQMSYYVGPKDYPSLKVLGRHQEDVMELGWFKPVCIFLLATLKAFCRVIPNYGVAIILLTIAIRLLFWPVTRKSAESMKKMQALQPQMAEIKEKYKNKPEKMQQETMALYKENKVNPVAGCLPMLIQLPVFYAFFVVLRSAVELRFARFLWIKDLCEPERLITFGFTIPLVNWDALNILPIVMTATSIWQMKLTPSSGDPQQQKMTMFMSVFLIYIMYDMASGLVLYWTTSQILMIVQLLWQKYKSPKPKPAQPVSVPVLHRGS